MPVADVKNLEGKKVGTIDLADDVFGVKVNAHLLHEAVRHHLASSHAGTHKTKDKSEVSGSGRKLWKQKGTGRARVGSIRSPLWRHGGTVHGPTPRSYSYALPKKMIIGALRSALSSKLAEQKITIVDAWELDTHKTKPFRLAGGQQRECEFGARKPEYRWTDAGPDEWPGSIRFTAARSFDDVARSSCEAEQGSLAKSPGTGRADSDSAGPVDKARR
jgi:hypothetical protein